MITNLTICNGALQKIGSSRIMAMDEDSKEGKICNAEYEKLRKSMLRRYPFRFACHRVTLSPEVSTPAFGFEYQFTLPADFLRLIELYDYDGEYTIEGTKLLCNTDVVHLRYVKDVTDFYQADPIFIDAFEWFIAHSICRYITDSETIRQECRQSYKEAVSDAKFIQSTEQNLKVVESYDLVEARFNSGFVRDPGT